MADEIFASSESMPKALNQEQIFEKYKQLSIETTIKYFYKSFKNHFIREETLQKS